VNRRTVLVLGGGVGGVVAAHVLRRGLDPDDRVVLVERAATHVFSPSLLWLMTGTRRSDAVQRDFTSLARRGIQVRQGQVTAIDPERRAVRVDGEELTGDALVVALGAPKVTFSGTAAGRVSGLTADWSGCGHGA
jgi:sulfide:quinone oxidoreductase